MEAAADEGLKKFSNDSVLKFFRAYAMVLQGMYMSFSNYYY
jgi:hypothetical protein